ncbi:hypothetical protein Droror1_Dr00025685 [Drosera rotundifolia]
MLWVFWGKTQNTEKDLFWAPLLCADLTRRSHLLCATCPLLSYSSPLLWADLTYSFSLLLSTTHSSPSSSSLALFSLQLVGIPQGSALSSNLCSEKKGKFRAIPTRAMLPCKIINAQWLERIRLSWLKTTLEQHKWLDLFELDNQLHPEAVTEFYENLSKMKLGESRFMLKSQVNSIAIRLGMPASGFGEYGKGSWRIVFQFDPLTISKKFSHNDSLTEATSVYIDTMTDEDRLLFSLMVQGILPRGSRKNEANGLNLTVMEHICRNEEDSEKLKEDEREQVQDRDLVHQREERKRAALNVLKG